MKKLLGSFLVTLTFLFVLSCQSTAQSTAQNDTKAGGPGAAAAPDDNSHLARIYDRHGEGIILAGAKTYTVMKNDTLSHIARAHYGAGDHPYYFPLIIAASKEGVDIVDPDSIEVGMQLTIPDLQANLNDPKARANLKSLLKAVADFYAAKPGAQSGGLHDGLTRLYNSL
ncbi:MAG: LysM peptidoglycan-binding domain-containing protein [Treponema sp.]|jgi:hypothetical protein|nr:LysM peptidoglycan-binding domain-containing protein [Treponema sp.]